MVDDKRTYDLTAITVGELSSLLNSLQLDVDDPSFAAGESKKLALSLLLTSAAVAEGSNIQHQALTPKGFASSLATTARKGIVEKSESSEMTSGTADKFPDCAQVKAADDAVKSYIGVRVRLIADVNNDGVASKRSGDLSVTGQKLSTGRYKITHNMGSSAYFVIANTTSSASIPIQYKIAAIFRDPNYFIVDISDDSNPNDSYFEFTMLQYGI